MMQTDPGPDPGLDSGPGPDPGPGSGLMLICQFVLFYPNFNP